MDRMYEHRKATVDIVFYEYERGLAQYYKQQTNMFTWLSTAQIYKYH